MRSLLACLVLSTLAVAACGDDGGDGGGGGGELGDRLEALPGVRVTEWFPPPNVDVPPGYRFFDLYVTLPVDHGDPGAGSFELYGALMHRDEHAPLVVYVGGYQAGWKRTLTEPARLIAGNQLSLEYRFYGGSRPASGIPWAKLRVDQAAADEHQVLEALGRIYDGNRIATGGSKGGENALLHHRAYPGDYDGVVAYVAPVITAFPDLRYDGILDRIGAADCRARLRGLGRRMLERRDALQARAQADGARYAVAGLDHAFETAVVELEFGFWMTRGEDECPMVPDPTTATDAALWEFLEDTGGPAAYGDDDLAAYGSQYLYQDHVELGYPIWMHAHLDDLLRFSYEDWSAYLPAGEPHVYDPTAARDLASWITTGAEHVLIIQGEWDPWAAGAPSVAPGRDAYQLWVPHGSHWSSGIYSLPPADAATAVAALRRWAGLDAGGARLALPLAPPPAPMATLGPDDPRVRARAIAEPASRARSVRD